MQILTVDRPVGPMEPSDALTIVFTHKDSERFRRLHQQLQSRRRPAAAVAGAETPSEAQWVAPPGWPVPPSGWSPPPGWQPDPSWPPAPPGWQWWRHPSPDRGVAADSGPYVPAPSPAPHTLPATVGPAGEPTGGFFATRKLRREIEAYERAAADWAVEDQELADLIDQARTFFGESADSGGFVLKPGERTYLIAQGAVLIEPRTGLGQFRGGSQGVSFRIAKGVSYRVGQSRGTYEPGPTRPTPIDSGAALISSQRVIFRGPMHSREWLYKNLVGLDHSSDGFWTALQVSNRQRVSGIGYGSEHADLVRFRLQLALTDWREQGRDDVISHLEQQRHAHREHQPRRPL